jgi:hypothetical protein
MGKIYGKMFPIIRVPIFEFIILQHIGFSSFFHQNWRGKANIAIILKGYSEVTILSNSFNDTVVIYSKWFENDLPSELNISDCRILYGERDYSLLLEKKIPPKIFNIINSLYEETKFTHQRKVQNIGNTISETDKQLAGPHKNSKKHIYEQHGLHENLDPVVMNR